MQITSLRTDGRNEAIGTGPDVRFSWRLMDQRRGTGQSCARVLVSAEADPLSEPASVAWDSGEVNTAEPSLDYAGPPLKSRTRYTWRVAIRDERGELTGWSEPASFETGIVDPQEWQAEWIGASWDQELSRRLPLDSVKMLQPLARVWHPGASTIITRTHLEVPAGRAVLAAPLVLAGAHKIRAWVNGTEVDARRESAEGGMTTLIADVAPLLRPAAHAGPALRNELLVHAEAAPGQPGGLIGRLEVVVERMGTVTVATDGSWEIAAAGTPPEPGKVPEPLDRWSPATVVAFQADPPWGREQWTHRPSPYLRTTFRVDQPVVRARLYSSALGVYQARVNGIPVSTDRLAPGWTDYNQRIAHQTYDVTALVAVGDNALAGILGDGWYAGNIAWLGPYQYGRQRAFLAELRVLLSDGSELCVTSGDSWKCGEGSIRYSDLQNGEVVDARVEPTGFDSPGFNDSTWAPAVVVPPPVGRLEPQVAPPVRVHEQIPPVSVFAAGPDRSIIDFGQNLAGHVQLRADGPAGKKVIIRHAEAVDTGGELYTINLRGARQTDEFVLAGTGEMTFEPLFSVHGFRYVEVTGLPAPIRSQDVKACATYADMEQIGRWSCSDPLLNQLQNNIVWGQRSNFLSVPTDCPQRDERLGWTGDAQVFASTAAFNYDVTAFMRKWLRDLLDDQRPGGGVPHVAPHIHNPDHSVLSDEQLSSAGWGDAIVMVPYEVWMASGDLTTVRETFHGALAWTEWLERWSDGGIRPASGFGDWLSLGPQTPKDLVSTAFAAHASHLLAELAAALGRTDDADVLRARHHRTREGFRRGFVRGAAEVLSGTQAAYVLALAFDLLDDDEIGAAVEHLVADIESRGWHLSTGFLATPYLLPTLATHGRIDVAYRLLTQQTYPSWLYPVLHGATTMWERWDTWSEHGGFQDPHMNSFNHYAYGAVGAFLYRWVSGLSPLSPGYRTFRVRPIPGGNLTNAQADLLTAYGPIKVAWRLNNPSRFEVEVSAPPGTEAEVWLGAVSAHAVTESGTPLASAEGIRDIHQNADELVVVAGAGDYRFSVEIASPTDSTTSSAQPC